MLEDYRADIKMSERKTSLFRTKKLEGVSFFVLLLPGPSLLTARPRLLNLLMGLGPVPLFNFCIFLKCLSLCFPVILGCVDLRWFMHGLSGYRPGS